MTDLSGARSAPVNTTYVCAANLHSTYRATPRGMSRRIMSIRADDQEFDEMVDVCRKAHEVVREHGTREMQAFTTALLHALAKEAAHRATAGGDGHDA